MFLSWCELEVYGAFKPARGDIGVVQGRVGNDCYGSKRERGDKEEEGAEVGTTGWKGGGEVNGEEQCVLYCNVN